MLPHGLMAGSFVKIYQTILDSSIWLEPDHVRLTWLTMLAMADQDGVVTASVGGLAHRARVSKEQCAAALEVLSAPDADSKDPANEGRRIGKVDDGWFIFNHEKYRSHRTGKQIAGAKRVQAWRERQKEGVTGNEGNTGKLSVRTESEAESDQKQSQKQITPSNEAPAAGTANTNQELPCPPNLLAIARSGGVIDELARAFGREREWVESIAYEFVECWTKGKLAGQPRKLWMSKLKAWVSDKHRKDEGPAPGAIAHHRNGGVIDDPMPRPQLSPKDQARLDKRLARIKAEGVVQ